MDTAATSDTATTSDTTTSASASASIPALTDATDTSPSIATAAVSAQTDLQWQLEISDVIIEAAAKEPVSLAVLLTVFYNGTPT